MKSNSLVIINCALAASSALTANVINVTASTAERGSLLKINYTVSGAHARTISHDAGISTQVGPTDAAGQTHDQAKHRSTNELEKKQRKFTTDDTIVVTGSHIRGTTAAGANVDVYHSKDLEQAGYGTVQDFLTTITQNFQGGGGNEDPSNGSLASSNYFGGSSVNLRGLGADSTLVLVNGRRVPASGFDGDFTDISTIPQTAIERIEILPDGASALYGSDAIGGVVNFILKKDYEGAETRFRYGNAPEGNLDEYRLAQTVGYNWDNGHFIINYEFYHRDSLKYKDRAFTESLDLRRFGGPDNRWFYANPGNILNPLTFLPAYAIPRNQNGHNLTVADLIPGETNFYDRTSAETLLPTQKRHSVLLIGEQQITETLALFTEIRFSERKAKSVGLPPMAVLVVPETNPFLVDPFEQDFALVAYSFEPDFGNSSANSKVKSANFTGGMTLELSRWQWEAYAIYGQEKSRNKQTNLDYAAVNAALADSDPETAFNPFGHGSVNNPLTLMGLRGEIIVRPQTQLFSVKSVADGPLFSFKDADVSLALGAEYRWDEYKFNAKFYGEDQPQTKLSRKVYSAFAEIFIPLIQEQENIPLVERLDVSIAGRVDDYSDVGTTTNPKIGLTWETAPFFSIKATYGTSFRAPNLTESTTADNASSIELLTDPQNPSGVSNTLILTGYHPEIEPEQADTWTVGLTYRPHYLSGLDIDLSYFETSFKDRIDRPTNMLTILQNSDLFPGLIIRNPSANQLAELCADPGFRGNPEQCVPGLVDAIVDFRNQNMSSTTIRGIDFSALLSKPVGNMDYSGGLQLTYLIDYIQKFTNASPEMELVDTLNNPIEFRARVHSSLSIEGLTGFVAMNYTDSYRNNIDNNKKIKSHTTFDFNVSASFDEKYNLVREGIYSFNFSIVNIFNNKPPVAINDVLAYDSDNFDPLGRFISLEMKIRW